MFYYIGSNNYYHHLIFTLFFLVLLASHFELNSRLIFVFTLILPSLFLNYGKTSTENLQNIDKLPNYPIYNLSKDIDSYFDKEYTILALDRVLVLFYLDKQNGHISCPTNHFENTS